MTVRFLSGQTRAPRTRGTRQESGLGSARDGPGARLRIELVAERALPLEFRQVVVSLAGEMNEVRQAREGRSLLRIPPVALDAARRDVLERRRDGWVLPLHHDARGSGRLRLRQER